MPFSVTELIGYVASALIVISLLMTSVLRLRIINLVGAAVFTAYGVIIGSIPIVITNGAIVLIDVWFLWKAATDEDYFSLLEVSHDSPYLARFLEFHRDEIERFVPGFAGHPGRDSLSILILRDMIPAGVFVAHRVDEGVLAVDLDYAIPQYRDFRLGEYLFEHRQDVFRDRGIHTVRAVAGTATHRRYLERVGFHETRPGVMERRPG